MTVSHGLVSSALLSGVIFAATTLPLTLFGSQPITLKVEEKPLFSGRFEELATPYLTLTTILSLGIGAATFGFLGWQSSSRKLNQVEAQISALKQQLQEKEALLEHFKFSEKKLQSAGLDFFLDSETAFHQPKSVSTLQAQPVLKEERQPNYFPTANLHRQAESPVSTNSNQTESVQLSAHNSYNLHDATQVEALLANLRQVMSQIEKLQAS